MIDLTNKSQAQKDVEEVNSTLRPVIANITAAIRALNNSRAVFWSFSDDRLNAMFAEIGAEKLQDVFKNHEASALLLNQLAEMCYIDDHVSIGALRDTQMVDGALCVVAKTPAIIQQEPPIETDNV